MRLDHCTETGKTIAAFQHGYEASSGMLFGDVEQQSGEVLEIGIR